MSNQVILRPVFNRPEMLQLSFEYEIEARNYYNFPYNLTTVFLIEYGSPQKTIDLVKEYPFEKKIILRTEKFGLSKNIFEGMKKAFDIANDYIICIEDDILVHKTYFEFMETFLNLIENEVGKFSYLSPGSIPSLSIFKVSKCKRYNSFAPIISKEFFVKYIEPCAIPVYYKHRWGFVENLSKKYQHNKAWRHGVTQKFSEQAGLIARLINVAEFEENMYAFGHTAARQRHIGYFGKNRPGGKIPGNNFEERLKNLKEIIKDTSKMHELSATKQYKDYYIFSPKLDSWDGTLILV